MIKEGEGGGGVAVLDGEVAVDDEEAEDDVLRTARMFVDGGGLVCSSTRISSWSREAARAASAFLRSEISASRSAILDWSCWNCSSRRRSRSAWKSMRWRSSSGDRRSLEGFGVGAGEIAGVLQVVRPRGGA